MLVSLSVISQYRRHQLRLVGAENLKAAFVQGGNLPAAREELAQMLHAESAQFAGKRLSLVLESGSGKRKSGLGRGLPHQFCTCKQNLHIFSVILSI